MNTTTTLPDGRTLEAGQEVKVSGEPGAFRFRYAHPNGDLTLWGPVDSQHAQWRSFTADRIRTIHRKPKSRAAGLALEVAA